MTSPAAWYADEGRLLDKVKRTRVHWGQVPTVPGYTQLIENDPELPDNY